MSPTEAAEKLNRHNAQLMETYKIAIETFNNIVNGQAPPENIMLAKQAWERFQKLMQEQEGINKIFLLITNFGVLIPDVDPTEAILENLPDDMPQN